VARQNPHCKKCLKYQDHGGDCIGVEEYSSEFQGRMFCFKRVTGSSKKDRLERLKIKYRIARSAQKQARQQALDINKQIKRLLKEK
jgi:hypothetical protein